MTWLAIATFAFTLAAFFEARKSAYSVWARAAGYISLVLGIISDFGSQAFQGSETSLMGYVAVAAAALFVAVIRPELKAWATAAAAVFLSLGFDVLRPDPYSYIPATILGVFVLLVAIRAYRRLSKEIKKKNASRDRLLLAGYVLSVVLLTYAALFKMIDRGWAQPWAYLASVGALLFAASQLWFGWKLVLRKAMAPLWMQNTSADFGMLLMTISAFFVYQAFL